MSPGPGLSHQLNLRTALATTKSKRPTASDGYRVELAQELCVADARGGEVGCVHIRINVGTYEV